ncbi:hypothetical protein [Streptomyces sp. NPDC047070]|uniref:hypothetical protein n=1 Tax=Streptomyces sp. NPDC047070 TaxID=3154923 RepID=UPI00345146A4
MTTITELAADTATDDDAPTIGALLLAAATNPRDQAAVRALVDEGEILIRDHVRMALVVKTEQGRMGCDWERLSKRLYTLGFDDQERAFLDLVLSIAGPHPTSLTRVLELDDRHLAIILRAMVQLSGCDTLAVGTRT